MIRRIIFLTIVFASLAGCNTDGHRKVSTTPPPPVDEVDRITPLVSPSPVNWDGQPGPDGLEVYVHLFRYSKGLPVTVRGSLEFVLYEGVIGVKDLASAKPFRSWRFNGKELNNHQIRVMTGWGYAMRLGWGQATPKSSSVTLLVRYISPKGRSVCSDPIVITHRPKIRKQTSEGGSAPITGSVRGSK